jgi:hypothetical protein
VTPDQWLACDDPLLMLEVLHGRASDRKLRLFAVACVRRVSYMVQDEGHPVDIAEKFADSTASEAERGVAENQSFWQDEFNRSVLVEPYTAPGEEIVEPYIPTAEYLAAEAAVSTLAIQAYDAALMTSRHVMKAIPIKSRKLEQAHQAHILRDIFRNPQATDNTDILRFTPTIITLAREIYVTRAFERMPELGDYLDKNLCSDMEILTHCWSNSFHVRGCWIVDLILSIDRQRNAGC